MVLSVRLESGFEHNTELGGEFCLIDKEKCPDEFEKCCKEHFGANDGHFAPHTYAFITYERGAQIRPLYTGQGNLLLNEQGGLFKDLTRK